MRKINNKLCLIILLVWLNLGILYDLIDAILTNTNIWFPIIIWLGEIIGLVIYRYIAQYGEKFGSLDHIGYGNIVPDCVIIEVKI